MRLEKARIDMPRITPGITSGISMRIDSACLPGKRQRSIRNAFAVPTVTDKAVTQVATTTLVQMLPSSSLSRNRPTLPAAALPRNQSSVKPRHGGAG